MGNQGFPVIVVALFSHFPPSGVPRELTLGFPIGARMKGRGWSRRYFLGSKEEAVSIPPWVLLGTSLSKGRDKVTAAAKGFH